MEKIDIKAALQWLDKGDVKHLAKLEGISARQASNIIAGKSRNHSFVGRLIEHAENNMRLAERTQVLRNNLTLIQ